MTTLIAANDGNDVKATAMKGEPNICAIFAATMRKLAGGHAVAVTSQRINKRTVDHLC